MTKTFSRLLLFLAGLSALSTVAILIARWTGTTGLVMEGGGPAGGDFINLWNAGKMVIDGQTADIYTPDAFMQYQQQFVSDDIGLRLWAYPPHSLLLALPFGFLNYWLALSIWSIIGLALLTYGARRFGFTWVETIVLVLSPAAMMCLYYGQTGNVAGGLLLLALASRHDRDGVTIGATTALTIKPQLGFMVPIMWAIDRRWRLIAATGIAVVAVTGIATLIFGTDTWDGYLNETIPLLNEFERHGTGSFEFMIPSFFMAFRILTGDGDLSANIHLGFAAVVFAVTVFHLWKSTDREQRAALLLVGTATITPYLHIYDMSMLLAAALLIARLWSRGRTAATIWGERAILIAWPLPLITFATNAFRVPISPLLLVALLVLAIKAPVGTSEGADDSAPAPVAA